MTSRRMSIGAGLTRGSGIISLVDQLQDILHAVHLGLGQPHYHHLLLAVLQHPQLGLAREQVEYLSTEILSYHNL